MFLGTNWLGNQTKELANQSRQAADTGVHDVQAMNTAMEELNNASGAIAKIIKTIDEIAFQTNLLALNAAVEAARAGDAGLGFAVVADEVRTLAQRSAQAAKETADKIEGTIAKTEQGVHLSAKVAQSLQEIAQKVRLVDALVAEEAIASAEQSQGIEQANTAASRMDKVTQSNAASAEESASAAEELHSQADALKGAVNELLALVGGAGDLGVNSPHESVPVLAAAEPKPRTNRDAARREWPRQRTEPARSYSQADSTISEQQPQRRANGAALPLAPGSGNILQGPPASLRQDLPAEQGRKKTHEGEHPECSARGVEVALRPSCQHRKELRTAINN